MSLSNPKWTYTTVRLPDHHGPNYDRLQCFPQGELLMEERMVGKSFRIWGEGVEYSNYFGPSASDLKKAHSLCQVQIGPKDYTAARILPNGQPEVPPSFASTHHALQSPDDGSWYFVPQSASVIPDAWLSRPDLIPKPRAKAKDSALSCQAKVPSAVVNEKEEPSAVAIKNGEETVSTGASTQNHGNVARTEASPIGNSGDPQLHNYQLTQLPNAPSPNPLDPIQTMDHLTNLIRQHLVCTDYQSTVLALWILHTYAYKAAHLTPYLNISSRVEESGKSTCMTILRSLCASPWWAAGVSRSAFSRKIIADHPTVLLDNWQTVFSSSDKNQMTGFLLTGCDQTPDSNYGNSGDYGNATGPNYPITNSPNYPMSFCPKAFAGPDPLPPSLARRSIPIVLERRKPSEVVRRAMNLLAPGATAKLTSWMQQWAHAHAKQIETTCENSGCQSQLSPGLTPHQQASAKILIALADVIGDDWPQKARAALPEVFKDAQQTEISLLSDIHDAFAHHGNRERIFTAELLEYLHDLDERIWHEWGKSGEPMTPHALSVILRKSFKIYSRSQRRSEDKRRGYQLSDFLEAWERYLPVPNPEQSTKDVQENSVAAIIEPVSFEKKPNSESPDNKHRTRRREVRQRAKTAAPHRVPALSKLKAGCRRMVNKFTTFGLLMIMH